MRMIVATEEIPVARAIKMSVAYGIDTVRHGRNTLGGGQEAAVDMQDLAADE